MAEQFGIDRSFGNGATVDGNIAGMLARTVGMDDFREKLLARTALAGYEHRQVYGSHLNGPVDSRDQSRRVADNAEPHLGLLYFR